MAGPYAHITLLHELINELSGGELVARASAPDLDERNRLVFWS